jgi:hypothetical protein
MLFRGKIVNDKRWVYGIYCPFNWDFFGKREQKPQIIILDENTKTDGLWCEIIPETVGQFTGKFDKTGTKIFEGDICEYIDDDGESSLFTVFWDDFRFRIISERNCFDDLDEFFCNRAVVVGNIHDNLLPLND